MRLLLVEDDRMIGAGVRKGLQQEGHVVDWVQDGAAPEGPLAADKYPRLLHDLRQPRHHR